MERCTDIKTTKAHTVMGGGGGERDLKIVDTTSKERECPSCIRYKIKTRLEKIIVFRYSEPF